MKVFTWIPLFVLALVSPVAAQLVAVDDYLSAVEGRDLEFFRQDLTANDLPDSGAEGFEIIEPPMWGELTLDTTGDAPVYRYAASAEALQAPGGVDFFTYELTLGQAVSTATVYVKVYPHRTVLAGHWPAGTAADSHEALGWYYAESQIFYLCQLLLLSQEGFIDNCVGYTLPVQVAGGGEPLTGDWNGDGIDDLGIYDPWATTFHLYTFRPGCAGDVCQVLDMYATFAWGSTGNLPVTGDWNHTGQDTVGLYDPWVGRFWLLHSSSDDATADQLSIRTPGRPVAGVWSYGDSGAATSVGLYDRVSQVLSYVVEGVASESPYNEMPGLGMPLSYNWGDVSGFAVYDSQRREILLMSHPDAAERHTRRVAVPKDP